MRSLSPYPRAVSMKFTPSSIARCRARTDSSSWAPIHIDPPMPHAPYPISDTERPVLPSGRQCTLPPDGLLIMLTPYYYRFTARRAKASAMFSPTWAGSSRRSPSAPHCVQRVVHGAEAAEDGLVAPGGRRRGPGLGRADYLLGSGRDVGVPAGPHPGQDGRALDAALGQGHGLDRMAEDVGPDLVPQSALRPAADAPDGLAGTLRAQASQRPAILQRDPLQHGTDEVGPLVAERGADERGPRPGAPQRPLAEQVREEKQPARPGLHLRRARGQRLEGCPGVTAAIRRQRQLIREPAERLPR